MISHFWNVNDPFVSNHDSKRTSLWEQDAAATMPATFGTGRLETVWKHRRTETATAGRCFWSAQRRDPVADLDRPTTESAAGAAFHRDATRPSPRRTSPLRHRHGRPQMRLLSARTSKILERGGAHRSATTRRWRREAGRTWPRDPAGQNPAGCLPDICLARLLTTTTTQ